MKISFLLLLAFFALPAAAQNTPATAQLPSGKLPAQVPDYCRWVVSYQYQKTASPSPAARPSPGKPDPSDKRIARISVVKTEKIVSQCTEWMSGQRSESWLVNKFLFERNPASREFSSTLADHRDVGFEPVQTGDFPEFSWIQATNFKGQELWQGRRVLLFQKENSATSNGSSSTTALIDAENRLPVLFQTGEERRLYEFSILPKAIQPLPPEINACIEKQNASIRRLLAPSARPF